MSAKKETFKTSDNKELIIFHHEAKDITQKVILLVHGHGEHGGRYDSLAQYFTEKGVAVSVLTLRGHGLSEGKRGHAPSMNQLILDVEYFIRQVRLKYMDADFYLYGHSMGGNIVLNYLIRDQSSEIKGGIVTSPWIQLAFQPPKIKLLLGNLVADIYPSYTEKSELNTEEISTIKEEVQRYEEDTLIHNKISAKLFQQITKGGKQIEEGYPKINQEVFLAHGELDLITSYSSTKELAAKSDKFSWHSYPNSKHEIHHDEDREQLMADMYNWLESH